VEWHMQVKQSMELLGQSFSPKDLEEVQRDK
jgi:hypothetical protein